MIRAFYSSAGTSFSAISIGVSVGLVLASVRPTRGDCPPDTTDPVITTCPTISTLNTHASITAWRSVRTHTTLGALAINLDPTASGNGVSGPTVETRNKGIQRIEVDFDEAMTLVSGGASITVTGISHISGTPQSPVSYTPSSISMVDSDTLAIVFPETPTSGYLPDETCYTINIAGAVVNGSSQSLAGDTDCMVRALVGDVDASGAVDSSDESLVHALVGALVLPDHIRFDLNLSGTMTSADQLLAHNRIGKQVFCSSTSANNCLATLGDYRGSLSATDNCGGSLTVTQSPTPGSQVANGDTITFTVTDTSSNDDTCTRNVTVQDVTIPMIIYPGSNQSAESTGGCQAQVPDMTGDVKAVDNCTAAGSLTITQSPTVGTYVDSGPNTVTITVKDAANNQATCTKTFTVVDTVYPTVTINQAGGQDDPTDGCDWAINYTVVFSEAVTGFDGSDIGFSGSARRHLIANVTHEPDVYDVYNVEVVGMFGSGTVTASVIANAAIDCAGNGNTASTSTDNTVTYSAPNAEADVVLAECDPFRFIELTHVGGGCPNFVITGLPSQGQLSDANSGDPITTTPYTLESGGNIVKYTITDQNVLSGCPDDSFTYGIDEYGNTEVAIDIRPCYRALNTTVEGDWAHVPQPRPITPSRWLDELPEVPGPGSTDRDDYMAFLLPYYEHDRPYAESIAGDPVYGQHLYARREAFFYKSNPTGTSEAGYTAAQHVARAMQFLHGVYAYYEPEAGPGGNQAVAGDALMMCAETWLWIKDSGLLEVGDDDFVHDLLIMLDHRIEHVFKYGATAGSLADTVGRKMVSVLYPGEADATEREEYCEARWNDWWTNRDHMVNSSAYTSIVLHVIAVWIEASGEESLYEDPDFQALIERYLAQATPFGFLPGYGDCVGFNSEPGQWIGLFERWASIFNDGRYKWAAHRCFEWTASREDDMDQWGGFAQWMVEPLMDAWLLDNDSITEEQPELSSMVTSRKAVILSEDPAYEGEVTDDVIPDKLILRSGWDANDMYALVELAPPMSHGHADTGSINWLSSQGSVLLTNPPYEVKLHDFHNCFQVIPPGPREYNPHAMLENMVTTVPEMHDGAQATYAQVHIENYMEQPTTLDRRIFFVKNKFIWVQDILNVSEELEAKIGPAWQTTNLYQARGDTWVDSAIVSAPVLSIDLPKYLMQWTNLPWDLQMVFLPTSGGGSGASMQIDDVSVDNTLTGSDAPVQNNLSHRVWYQKDTTLEPETEYRFNSLLIPHAPQADCTQSDDAYSLELDYPGETIVKIVISENETIWLGMNEAADTVSAGPLYTNAKWFMVDDFGCGASYWLVDATIATMNDVTIYSSGTPATLEYQLPVSSGALVTDAFYNGDEGHFYFDSDVTIGTPGAEAAIELFIDYEWVTGELVSNDGDNGIIVSLSDPIPSDTPWRIVAQPTTFSADEGDLAVPQCGTLRAGPVATAWRSVRTHTTLGALGIVLNPTATGNGTSGPAVETRNKGIQRIEVDFNQNVALVSGGAAITVTGVSHISGTPQSPVSYTPNSISMVDDDTLAITFVETPTTGYLPDETCYTINLAGAIQDVFGRNLGGDTDCKVRALIADVDSSGVADTSDGSLITSKVTSPATDVSPDNIRIDLNLGGTITSADRLLANNKSGNAVYCP